MKVSALGLYCFINTFIFLLCIYILFKITPDLGKKSQVAVFRAFVIAACMFIVLNTIHTLQQEDYIKLSRVGYTIVAFFIYLIISYVSFCYYSVTIMRFEEQLSKNKFIKVFGSIPFGISFIALVISLFNGMCFSVDENVTLQLGPLYLLIPLCSLAYFIAIIVISLVFLIRTKTPKIRRNCLILIFTVTFLIFWVILDNFVEGISLLPVAIFFVVLVLFINMLQQNVYIDSLTNISNRRKCEEHLAAQISISSSINKYIVYILDLNSFKIINDTYGHGEGDRALIMLADVIRKQADIHKGYCFRYGGDEFIITMRVNDSFDPKSIMDDIQKDLTKECEIQDKKYSLTISYGYIYCDNNAKSVTYYLNNADKMLYENKKIYHSRVD